MADRISEEMRVLEDVKIPVRYRLMSLWTALMFCYIYGDYFELYHPGKLDSMLAGRTALGPVTQGALLGMSAMLVVPALMIALSLILPATICRWASIVLGVVYAAIMVLAIQGTWRFYIFFGVIEIMISAAIVWSAWRWPQSVTTMTGPPPE